MLLIAIGFCLGALGTLIGVGGGFVAVPILLALYPQAPSEWITSVSMGMVAMNATSGSSAYYLKGKVHLRAALAFFLASLPGSALGVWAEGFVSRSTFEMIFGAAMLVYAVVLVFKKARHESASSLTAQSPLTPRFLLIGCAISFVVGFVASFLGIGGGIIHVPLLAHVLDFPVHLAAGTSHLILALTSWFTIALHLFRGDIQIAEPAMWQLGISAALGAQLGAWASPRVSGQWILRLLAVGLAFAGVRLLLPAFHV